MSALPAQPSAPAWSWQQAIAKATASRPKAVGASTFLHRRTSASQPVDLACDDGKTYVVKAMLKARNQGRMLFNDQVIARLGALISAPVADVALIEVSRELIDANPANNQMGHLVPCIAHGSARFANVSDRIDGMSNVDKGENRARFSALAVLSGWVMSSDRQFIYDAAEPYQVYSVDHGHWFPGGDHNWTVAMLKGAPAAQIDGQIVSGCGLRSDDIASVCDLLARVTNDQIAEILAIPPDEWGVTIAERIAVGEFLAERRDVLAAAHKTKVH